jgi:hypothetical protein
MVSVASNPDKLILELMQYANKDWLEILALAN